MPKSKIRKSKISKSKPKKQKGPLTHDQAIKLHKFFCKMEIFHILGKCKELTDDEAEIAYEIISKYLPEPGEYYQFDYDDEDEENSYFILSLSTVVYICHVDKETNKFIFGDWSGDCCSRD